MFVADKGCQQMKSVTLLGKRISSPKSLVKLFPFEWS